MNYDRLLEGKRAFVSSAASGVGRAIALLFARHGASVAFTDIDDDAGRQTERELKAIAPQSFYLHADMADRDETEAACREVLARWSRVDCLVNNAGRFERATLHETAPEDLAKLVQLNYMSAVRCTRFFLEPMMQACAGTIVNISSDYTEGSVPQVSAYAATKGALSAFGRAVALDYSHYGIRCNNLMLGMNMESVGRAYEAQMPRTAVGGFTDTQPLQRRATAEDAAKAALYLASKMSQFMTGESIPVDGGIQVVAHVQNGWWD